MSVVLCFVHLGENPSPTLLSYSKIAKQFLPSAELVLITNHPSNWKSFSGRIINYSAKFSFNYRGKIALFHYDKFKVANGYWINTLERIFALDTLKYYFPSHSTILHFESDVLSFVNPQILEILKDKITKTAVPRYSDNLGIASFLFSPSIEQLSKDLSFLEDVFRTNSGWLTDMQLLNLGLKTGILQDLNEITNDSKLTLNSNRYPTYFDPAFLGQYLFGRDALHTKGNILSGYVSEYATLPLSPSYFETILIDNLPTIVYQSPNQDAIIIGNLHIHSKIPFKNLEDFESMLVLSLKKIQNGNNDFLSIGVEDVIHTNNGNFFARVVRFLRKFFSNYLECNQ